MVAKQKIVLDHVSGGFPNDTAALVIVRTTGNDTFVYTVERESSRSTVVKWVARTLKGRAKTIHWLDDLLELEKASKATPKIT